MVEIAPAPGIRVKVYTEAGSLTRVSLFSSPTFSLDGDNPKILAWLKSYAAKKPLPFPLPMTDGFHGDVLRFLQTIPLGTVMTYKDVAKAVGSPLAARAIGNICRGNLFPLLIPCHRVVKSDGTLGQYTPDPTLKKKLLYFEGVTSFSADGVS